MMKYILFFLSCFYSVFIFSQEAVVLKGKIQADDLAGTYINIINMTHETGTVSRPSGEFEVVVSVNDSLMFSSLQYKTLKLRITPEIIKRGFLEVQMEENVNELSEVEISNISLTGNLQKDLPTIPTFTQADMGFAMTDKPLPTSIERKLHTASGVQTKSARNPAGLVNVSFDGILNSMNGKIEMLQKAKENEDLHNLAVAGMNALPQKFFIEDLKVPESEIKNFIYFCTETSYFQNLLRKEKLLELIEFYQRKAPIFISERMGK